MVRESREARAGVDCLQGFAGVRERRVSGLGTVRCGEAGFLFFRLSPFSFFPFQ